MWVDGEGVGILSLGQGQSALHAWPTHARDWRGGQLSRFFPSFMALFVSPPDSESQGRLTVSALLKLRVTAVLA